MNINRTMGAFLVLLSLAACSGSGDSLLAGGDITGSGMTVGPVEGFGSIVVNGERYETDSAEIRIDRMPASLDALRAGMVVSVETAGGNALRIAFQYTVIGPVQALHPRSQSLTVAGQRVFMEALTRYEGIDGFADLQVGDVVAVSGFLDPDDQIDARYLKRLQHSDSFRVQNIVRNLDPVAQTFTLGGLRVDYSRPQIMDGTPEEGRRASVDGELRDGVLVAQSYADTGTVLAAGLEAQARIDLEGLVNVFQSPENFELVHVPAHTDKQRTVFIDGTHTELGPGVELAAGGYLEEDGRVFLERVQFLSAAAKRTPVGEISLSAPLQAVDPAAGTLSVLDFTFVTDAATVFYDFHAHQPAFDLIHLEAGDWITISALPPQTGMPLIATKVQHDRVLPKRLIHVKGQAGDIDPAQRRLRVLGIPVRATADTLYVDDRPPVNDEPPPPPPPPADNGGEGGEAPPPPPPSLPEDDGGAPPAERTEISAAQFFRTAPEADFVTVYGRLEEDVLVAAELVLAP